MEQRLRSLDGLRALSIVLVLFGHLEGTQGFTLVLRPYLGDYAHFGVIVFFVISGFLITNLLIAEQVRTSRVSLKLFYARRSLRIIPASYTYITVIVILSMSGILSVSAGHLQRAATYTVNFLANPSWPIGHLWSLSVEEQFYLFWPLTFVLLKPRRAPWAIAAVIIAAPLLRHELSWWFAQAHGWLSPIVGDSLATGCLLAFCHGWLEQQGWYLWLFQPIISLLILVLVFATNRLHPWGFGAPVINTGIAILINRAVFRSHDLPGRILNARPLVFIGALSYSLYIWQQPFLNRYSTRWVAAFPQNIALAVGAALCSYSLLEKPLLRLRHGLYDRRPRHVGRPPLESERAASVVQ